VRNRRLIKRRSVQRRAQRYVPLEPKQFVEQHSPGFVPPTKEEIEKRQLLDMLQKRSKDRFEKDMAEQARLCRAAQAIAVLRDLPNRRIEGVAEEDQAAVKQQIVEATWATRAPANVKGIVVVYQRNREIRQAIRDLMQQMHRIFQGISKQQAHAYVINEILANGEPWTEPFATAGARVMGMSPPNFSKLVWKAWPKLGNEGRYAVSRIVTADAHARDLLLPYTDAQYDAMIGPANRVGGRSIDTRGKSTDPAT
jgi:hypothetical protein